MAEKQPLRRRVTPHFPFTLEIEEADGSKTLVSFRLAFGLNALTQFEEVTGLSFLTDLTPIFDTPNVKTITALFWVALIENHPEYDSFDGLQAVRSMIDFGSLKKVLVACIDAFILNTPKEQQERMKKVADAKRRALLGVATEDGAAPETQNTAPLA